MNTNLSFKFAVFVLLVLVLLFASYVTVFERSPLHNFGHHPRNSLLSGFTWNPFRRLARDTDHSSRLPALRSQPPLNLTCTYAIVLYSAPSNAPILTNASNLSDWCIILLTPVEIDSSNQTPQDHSLSSTDAEPADPEFTAVANYSIAYNVVSLDDDRLLSVLPYRTAKHFLDNRNQYSPHQALNTLANIAYLLAVHLGAEKIVDLAHDVQIPNLACLVNVTTQEPTYFSLAESPPSFNPHVFYEPFSVRENRPVPRSWPLGFPVHDIDTSHRASRITSTTVLSIKVSVISALVNIYPDVGFLYATTTSHVPLVFRNRTANIAVPQNSFTPLSSSFTIWKRTSFPTLFRPPSEPTQQSDLLRGHVAQAILHFAGLTVGFVPPVTARLSTTEGGSQPTPEAFDDEAKFANDLQKISVSLSLDNITRLVGPRASFLSIVQAVYKRLHDDSHVNLSDVDAANTWINDMQLIDSVRNITLMTGAITNVPNFSVNTQALKEANVTISNQSKVGRVAVCVSGQVRTLDLQLDDPRFPKRWIQAYTSRPMANLTVAESIQQRLFPKLGTPDVFMVISTREGPHEPRVGNLSVCEPLRPRDGGLLRCVVKAEKEEELLRNDTLWKHFVFKFTHGEKHLDQYPLMQGLLQQLRGIYDCHIEIERHMAETGIEYDWIVRIRPDYYVMDFPSLEQLALDSDGKTVWYANKSVCCCGNEDKFGIGPARLMHAYLQRFAHFQGTAWSSAKIWNAEGYLINFLKNKGIALLEHPAIEMCSVRPVDYSGRSVA